MHLYSRSPGMATSKPVVRHSEMDAGTPWFDWLKDGNEVARDCVSSDSSNYLGFILIYRFCLQGFEETVA